MNREPKLVSHIFSMPWLVSHQLEVCFHLQKREKSSVQNNLHEHLQHSLDCFNIASQQHFSSETISLFHPSYLHPAASQAREQQPLTNPARPCESYPSNFLEGNIAPPAPEPQHLQVAPWLGRRPVRSTLTNYLTFPEFSWMMSNECPEILYKISWDNHTLQGLTVDFLQWPAIQHQQPRGWMISQVLTLLNSLQN